MWQKKKRLGVSRGGVNLATRSVSRVGESENASRITFGAKKETSETNLENVKELE